MKYIEDEDLRGEDVFTLTLRCYPAIPARMETMELIKKLDEILPKYCGAWEFELKMNQKAALHFNDHPFVIKKDDE